MGRGARIVHLTEQGRMLRRRRARRNLAPAGAGDPPSLRSKGGGRIDHVTPGVPIASRSGWVGGVAQGWSLGGPFMSNVGSSIGQPCNVVVSFAASSGRTPRGISPVTPRRKENLTCNQ